MTLSFPFLSSFFHIHLSIPRPPAPFLERPKFIFRSRLVKKYMNESRPPPPLIAINEDLTLAPCPRGRGVITAILVLFPIRQYGADARAVGQFVHLLKVFLAEFKRLGRYVGDVFAD